MNPTYDPRLDLSYSKEYDYNGSSNLIYEGSAVPGTSTSAAGWAIKQYVYVSGNCVSVAWAGGNNQLANIWANRTSLSYS